MTCNANVEQFNKSKILQKNQLQNEDLQKSNKERTYIHSLIKPRTTEKKEQFPVILLFLVG